MAQDNFSISQLTKFINIQLFLKMWLVLKKS